MPTWFVETRAIPVNGRKPMSEFKQAVLFALCAAAVALTAMALSA